MSACDGHNAACDARALHIGSYSSWLMKVKGDGARARWMSSASKRYFTIDYDSQLFYYSHSQDRRKISNPIRFKEIVGAEQLPRPSQAPFKGLSSRSSQKKKESTEFTFGFVVQTPGRNYELYTGTYLDAKHWVDGLIAGRDIANGISELKPSTGYAAGSSVKTPIQTSSREPSRSSLSTTADGGSDSGRSSEHEYSRCHGHNATSSSMPPQHRNVPSRPPPPQNNSISNSVSSGYGTQAPPVAVGNYPSSSSGGFPPSSGYGGGGVANAPHSSQQSQPNPQPQPMLAPPVANGGSSGLHFQAPPTVPARTFAASPEVSMMPPQGGEVDPFAALDALEELAGALPTQASSSVEAAPSRPQQNIQGALLREARNIVTNKGKPSAEASEALQRFKSNPSVSGSQSGSTFVPPQQSVAQQSVAQQSVAPVPQPVEPSTVAPPLAPAPQALQQPLQQAPVQNRQPSEHPSRQQQQQKPPSYQQQQPQQQPKQVVAAMTYHNPSAESWDSDEDESQNTGLVKAAAPPPLAPPATEQKSPKKSTVQTPAVKNGWTAPANTRASPAKPAKKVDPQASGWDSDDDDDVPVKQQAVPPPLHHQQATATAAVDGLSDNDWDDDDNTAVKAPIRTKAQKPLARDSCGAPLQPMEAFVTASKPVAQVVDKKKEGSDDDLDDLVGEVLAASGPSVPSRSSTSHGLVPGFQCTGCDFQVLRIDNYIWGTGVEYMFFRNNYPNVQKMRPQLVPRKDCCAYCCQCSWKSAEAAAPLEDVAAGLRWRKIGF